MTTKQAIFEVIEQLPEQQLEDVLRYVRHLADKNPQNQNPPTSSNDPLANFIGAVSFGSLAANLDSELYGD
ncbi:hypothetical protein AMR41_13340 [Hapalosiphon sp. MRB220]|nr:hypothetical protein AMR41_13340 [Hapalosiphon sp. MRB220]